MPLLLLQLSDIHLKSTTTEPLERIGSLVNSVKNIERNLSLCVVAITGDIAFSGKGEEYEVALDFVTALNAALQNALPAGVKIKSVIIPGNHDCDFSVPGAARTRVIDSLLSESTPNLDDSEIDLCTTVQSAFFDFRSVLADESLSASPKSIGYLYYEYHLTADETPVVIRCYNSAWLSQKNEQQGSLLFPSDCIRKVDDEKTLTISLIHHPYNWFESSNARKLRRCLESMSDVILTGHEHVPSKREQRNESGEINLYIEGGVLFETHNPNSSSFNALVLDQNTRRQKNFRFVLHDGMYTSEKDAEWEPLQTNQLRDRTNFKIKPEFADFLEDPGLVLNGRGGDDVRLSDFFCWPDLRPVTYEPTDTPIISSEPLFKPSNNAQRLIVTGAEQSGKTSLGKRIFSEAHDAGFIPVWLDGSSLKINSDSSAVKAIEKSVVAQYGEDRLELYKQSDITRKVVIIDNLEAARFAKVKPADFIQQLTSIANRVIVLSNDIAYQVEDIVAAARKIGDEEEFSHYRIQPFGHLRRMQLTELWYLRRNETEVDASLLAHQVMTTKRTLDTVIGKNFVPAYPVYLVAMLQAQETQEGTDPGASTHGYFYELLIKGALARGSTALQYNVKVAFLTFMAAWMYKQAKPRITEADFIEIHMEYTTQYLMALSFVDIEAELLKCGILRKHLPANNTDVICYEFKYPYFFYYFVASYFKDNIAEQRVRDWITEMSTSLTQEDSANILLFLVHLSHDRFIIERMLEQAEKHFADCSAVTLDGDLTVPDDIKQLITEIVHTEKDSASYRRQLMEDLDRATSNERTAVLLEPNEQNVISNKTAEQRAISEYISQIQSAFKTLQILGQILKNFGGGIVGPTKVDITSACYNLGLRTLGSLFQTIKASTAEAVDAFIEDLRAEHKELNDDELRDRARSGLFGLMYMTSYGTIKRISYAVGAPVLMPTFDMVRQSDPTPAKKLVHAALQLDQAKGFPRREIATLYREIASNMTAVTLLRSMVRHHFYLFSVPYDTMQKVCTDLEIKYVSSLGQDPKRKLIETRKQH